MKQLTLCFVPFIIFIFLAACTRSSSQAPTFTTQPNLPSPTPSPTFQPESPNTPLTSPSATPTPNSQPTHTLPPTETPLPADLPLLTFIFTGQINLDGCEPPQSEALYAEVLELIQPADLTVGAVNETSASSECSSENVNALAQFGFDVVNITVHCGEAECSEQTSFDIFLQQAGIQTVPKIDLQANVVDVQGIRFGFVSVGVDTSRIDNFNEKDLRMELQLMRDLSDVVIFSPNWDSGEDLMPNPSQHTFAETAVGAGADLIIANSPSIEAFGEVDGTPVFYGLGTLVSSNADEQGLILRVYFRGKEYLGFEIFPTVTEQDGTVHLADEKLTAEILDNLQKVNETLP